jgi:DNA-binding response OmpR family regulator
VLELGPRSLRPPGGPDISLSEQDLTVLHELMRNAGNIVSRRQIIEALDEDFFSYDQRRLDTQMRRLRRKVEESCGLTLPINTARNVGYRFHAKALISA